MAKIDLSNFDKIIVLDFGSQYNQLITRRIRDFGIYSELLPHTITAEEVNQIAPKGIIFSGGPNSVYDETPWALTRKSSSWGFQSWASATGCS